MGSLKSYLFTLCCALAVLALALAAPARAAQKAEVKQGDTRIESEKMVYDAESRTVVFEGNVHVTRPDVEIWSKKLTMVLSPAPEGAPPESGNSLGIQGGKVERIIAENSVRFKHQTKQGTCGKATFFVDANRILMEQSPVLIDGENRLSGQVINYFMESGRGEVTGKVNALIVSDASGGQGLPGVSTPPPGGGSDGKVGTQITSSKMTYDPAKNRVVFLDQAHVTRPDLQIWSESLEIHLQKDGAKSPQAGKIERIVALNDVRIEQENRVGTCGKATYFLEAGHILMQDNPVVIEGENRLRGQEINYYTETGLSQATGEVDVRFTTRDDGRNGNGQGTGL